MCRRGSRPRSIGPAPGGRAAAQYDQFIEECLAGGVRAALVHSDHDVIELMRRMRLRHLHAPKDLAFIACDDEIASLADVPLTAVAPPEREIEQQAARLLLSRLDASDPLSVPVRQLFIQPRPTVRASCGTHAGA
ncbi:substrate-binding domain-containing protein [Streptomyces pratensis]|uniref:substrate-binding domain-containing protein n=1 Tax=Streptomyces pratensis TaxID=1169025 RepID=UPI00363B54F7